MQKDELIPHLFRTEFRKIASVLCRRLGVDRMETAEDIASETFLTAVETWTYQGIPENPVAWLHKVARNKAINHLARHHIFAYKVAAEVRSAPEETAGEIDFSDRNITDSQLAMLFALCHPSISTEAQVGLSLRILCGFGIDEIASAFLTTRETINKRLFRAREKLRAARVRAELPSAEEVDKRLEAVLTTLYLLFSEGYYSDSHDEVLRKDLCLEAMRLANLLIETPATNRPEVNALMSLMCFHASRFDARKNTNGELILYDDQDEGLWNKDLIARGTWFLHQSSKQGRPSKYHIEAGIAYWHTIKADTREKWENILQLYNRLLRIEYSPIAALNRTYALSKANNKQEAILEAEKLQLTNNHFYFTLLGELYRGMDEGKSMENLQQALALARTNTDRATIQSMINKLAS